MQVSCIGILNLQIFYWVSQNDFVLKENESLYFIFILIV